MSLAAVAGTPMVGEETVWVLVPPLSPHSCAGGSPRVYPHVLLSPWGRSPGTPTLHTRVGALIKASGAGTGEVTPALAVSQEAFWVLGTGR